MKNNSIISDSPDNSETQARALIDTIFQTSYSKLVSYAKTAISGSSVGDIGQAEDIVQEAMIIAINNADSFCRSDNPTGWLILTIRNVAKNTIRSDQRLASLVTEYTITADTVKDDSHSVDFLLSGIIPDEDFQLLKHYYVDGYTYRDLQKQLNLGTSALSMRLKRAKSKFVKNYFLSGGKSDTTEHNKTGGVANDQ